jgi:hypothetical protein
MTVLNPPATSLDKVTTAELIDRLTTLSDALRVATNRYRDPCVDWIHDKWDAINIELGRRDL